MPASRQRRALERWLRALPYPLAVQLVIRVAAPCARAFGGDLDPRVPAELRLALTGAPHVRRRLLTMLLGTARLEALSRSRWPAEGCQWFEVSGLETLERARAAGKVIVVNSHYGATQCVPLLLARFGFRFHSVECCDPFAALGLPRPDGLTVIPTAGSFLGQVAVRGRRALDEEGMICIAADGYVGESRIGLPFHGRARGFVTGFAELSVAANASVVPALAPVDGRGIVRLQLYPALAAPDPSLSRSDRVRALVCQYATWLEERWTEDPGNVFNLERYAALPPWLPRGRTE